MVYEDTIDSPTNDTIELWVCGDQVSIDEDTPLNIIEIFIK